MSTPAYWALVPAAGLGTRMGKVLPKQYLPLGDKTVLEHSMEVLLDHAKIVGLVAIIAPEDSHFQALYERLSNSGKSLVVESGGSERRESVLKGLQRLAEFADLRDWVLVHDAVRPCLRPRDLNKLIEGLSEHPIGGLLARRVTETVKRADARRNVLGTQDRKTLWLAQTPQMFRLGALTEALLLARSHGVEVTDEAQAMEWSGHTPLLLEGAIDNIKITHPEDVAIAEFYLQRQRQEP